MAKGKSQYSALKNTITGKKARISVIGLGYVGLPLAVCFAKKGFSTVGIDIDEDRVEKIKDGICYILDVPVSDIKRVVRAGKFSATTDFSCIKETDAVIICVPTPLGKNHEPDTSYIREAVDKVKRNMRKGQVIVLESTTYPGTTREILLPVLESDGFKEGRDFFLAFSPERIDPGNAVYKTENTPKVIGGMSAKSTDIACLLYRQVINRVVPVSSASAAEMVKLLENTFRIVNIAMVNEIMTLCEKFGLDIWEIIDAAKTKPYGFMPFYPGPGVGGHCIPVDPLYLSWKAKEHGFETKFINLASAVNEAMPQYVVDRLEKIAACPGKSLNDMKILVIGVAYKKDVKDLRESPALHIISSLERRGTRVSYYDPLFPYLKIDGIDLKCAGAGAKELKTYDGAVLAVDHTDVDYKQLAAGLRVILDTRNVFEKLGIRSKNIIKL
ncbi:MAG: nucleotide sugar dehydrogenase [Candidatus Omnitrophota bacterium]